MEKIMRENDGVRRVATFPSVFPLSLSHAEFPTDKDTADSFGMQLGCLLTPFIALEDRSQALERTAIPTEDGSQVARCKTCSAYINPFCEMNKHRWFCSLCGGRNGFVRDKGRYRKRDVAGLPESQNILVDYEIPFKHISTVGKVHEVTSVPSYERPFVHVFLVQESMSVDTLQTVVEGLSTAIEAMHPDMFVVILTFSYRVGIHRIQSGAQPTIQYVHLGMRQRQGQCAVFEGNAHEDVKSSSGQGGDANADVVMPLASAVDFFQTACRVGNCRSALLQAVNNLFDAFTPIVMNDSDDTSRDDHLPKVMIGPALSALGKWVCDDGREDVLSEKIQNNMSKDVGGVGADSDDDDDMGFGFGLGSLIGSLKGLSVGLLGGDTDSRYEGSGGPSVDVFDERASNDVPKSAAELCSGVAVHVFVDTPQDLPARTHESAPKEVNDTNADKKSTESLGVDGQWAEEMGTYFANANVCVNIYGLSSFTGQHTRLNSLLPIASKTGGVAHRCVLGTYPKDERVRFSEILRKAVTQQYATKGLVRLRVPAFLESKADMASSAFRSDVDLPGVYRIASCSPCSSLGLELAYNRGDTTQTPKNNGNSFVMQLAFSYDTLVESDESLLEGDDDDDHAANLLRHAQLQEGKTSKNDKTLVKTASKSLSRANSTTSLMSERSVPDVASRLDNLKVKEYVNSIAEIFDITDQVAVRDRYRARCTRREYRRKKYKTPKSSSKRQKSRDLSPSSDYDSKSSSDNDTGDERDSDRETESAVYENSELSVARWQPVYDNTKALVSVRRLRVLTVIVECSDSIPRLLQCCHPATNAVLALRRAVAIDRPTIGHAGSEGHDKNGKQGNTKTSKLTTPIGVKSRGAEWVFEVGATLVYVTFMSMSDAANDKRVSKSILSEELDTIIRHPIIVQHLRLLFGGLNVLNYLHTVIGEDTGDELAEYLSTLCTADAQTLSKLLYPHLILLDENLVLDGASVEAPLALRRDTMLMTSLQATSQPADAFLLDCGTELVLYKTLRMSACTKHNKSPPNSYPFSNNSHEKCPAEVNPSSKGTEGTLTEDALRILKASSLEEFYPDPNAGEGAGSLKPISYTENPSTAVAQSAQAGTVSMNMSRKLSAGLGAPSALNHSQVQVHVQSQLGTSLRSGPEAIEASQSEYQKISTEKKNISNREKKSVSPVPLSTTPPPTQSMNTATSGSVGTDTGSGTKLGSHQQAPRYPEREKASEKTGKAQRRSLSRSQSNLSDVSQMSVPESELVSNHVKRIYAGELWLGNEVDRRLAVGQGLTPKAFSAEAGTSSAEYFTERLMEDASRIDGKSFDEFCRAIAGMVTMMLTADE